MSQVIIESLACFDGYHMFYLIYGAHDRYQIHREPLKFKFDHKKKILTGSFNNFAEIIEHSSHEQLEFAIWREVIAIDSQQEMDFETTERALNSADPIIYHSVIETFTYDIQDSYICADMPTVIMIGNRFVENSLIVYMKRNHDKNNTNIGHISFEIKLN